MESWKLLQELRVAEDTVKTKEAAFLRSMGWEFTCDTFSLWLWAKEIDGKQMRVDTAAAMHIAMREVKWPYDGEPEHPEGYDGECGCNTCMSYG